MQIDIIKGIYVDGADYREFYPINLMPSYMQSGVSSSYLKLVEGIQGIDDISNIGIDRGGINVEGLLYRAIGSKFFYVTPTNGIVEIGNITNDNNNVLFAYSFDKIAIVSNKKAFLYDYLSGAGFEEITDPDLGLVDSVIWVDGYFVFSDGEFIIVTELNDPKSIDPFKYGSSEANPDPIIALLKLKNEVVALNRYTIEFFSNVNSTGFPFSRISGAQIMRGCIGKEACCVIDNSIMFLGGGENEEIGIYEGGNGSSVKISSKELDRIISQYTEQELSLTKLELRLIQDELLLYVHFLRDTYVYNFTASRLLQNKIWFRLDSFEDGVNNYFDAWNFVYCYNNWYCGRRSQDGIGVLSFDVKKHWGMDVKWCFQTPILFNEDRGGIVHEISLQGNVNNLPLQNQSYIGTQYSYDGVNFSQVKYVYSGTQGARNSRYRWRNNGYFEKTRIQRFFGNSDVDISFSRLDARIEGLRW